MTDIRGCFPAYDTGVISIGDVITTNHCLVLTEMNWCHGSEWFVGIFL